MKKRIFYIINLDNRRIAVLGIVFTGLLAVAFATGYRLGRSDESDPYAKLAENDLHLDQSDFSINSEESANTDVNSLNTGKREDTESGDTKAPSRGISIASQETVSPEADKKPITVKTSSREKSNVTTFQSAPEVKRDTNKRNVVLQSDAAVKLSDIGTGQKRVTTNNNKATSEKKQIDVQEDREFYSFQMGAFSDKGSADRLKSTLEKDGFSPYIKKMGSRYSVRVGKSTSRRRLWGLEAKLKKYDYSFFLISD